MIYKDQLEAVYRLIEQPDHWCQNAYWRDKYGSQFVDEQNPAAQWCLDGAAQECGLSNHGPSYQEWKAALGHHNPIHFNDTHTHAEVLDLLRSAIDRAPVRP